MEEMVRSMLQYKGKLEALKSEKASLSINYEVSLVILNGVMNLLHRAKQYYYKSSARCFIR